jgi:hypothetical protein
MSKVHIQVILIFISLFLTNEIAETHNTFAQNFTENKYRLYGYTPGSF